MHSQTPLLTPIQPSSLFYIHVLHYTHFCGDNNNGTCTASEKDITTLSTKSNGGQRAERKHKGFRKRIGFQIAFVFDGKKQQSESGCNENKLHKGIMIQRQ
jgi:hypothetical protein